MFVDLSKIILLSDMDGTLLSEDKSLPQCNREAIARFRSSGGTFVVATGRVLQASKRYMEALELDCPAILSNGGMIYDCSDKRIRWAKYLCEDIAREIVSRALERFPMVCAEICTNYGIYNVNLNETEIVHRKKGGFDAEVMDSIYDVPSGEWNKVLFAMPSELISEFTLFCRELPHSCDVRFVTSSSVYHEMLPKNCSKGSAMKMLAQIYGIDNAVFIAIGDYFNDIEMLRQADLAACPSNALDPVKDICGHICRRSCGDGAVAELIDGILSGNIDPISAHCN